VRAEEQTPYLTVCKRGRCLCWDGKQGSSQHHRSPGHKLIALPKAGHHGKEGKPSRWRRILGEENVPTSYLSHGHSYGCLQNAINHRITECFGLEGTFRGHPAQPPCSEQGHLHLDQVAQNPVQPGLECFQGWGIDHPAGQPVPGFHPLLWPFCSGQKGQRAVKKVSDMETKYS